MSNVRKRAGVALLAASTLSVIAVPFVGAPAGASGAAAPAQPVVHQATNAAGQPDGQDVWLSWAPVAGATGYDIQVSSSSDWSDDSAVTVTSESTAPAFALPADLPHATYWWRVRAKTSVGTSDWTDGTSFERAWNDRPTGLKSNSSKWMDVSWAPMADASYYEIELSTDPSFADPDPVQGTNVDKPGDDLLRCYTANPAWNPSKDTVGQSTVAQCEPNPWNFHYDTTYYWRVRGRNDIATQAGKYNTAGDSTCTGVWHSENVTKAPATPECSLWSADGTTELPSPTSIGDVRTIAAPSGLTDNCGTACSATPILSWNDVTGATKYRVTVARDRAMTNITHIYDIYDNRLLDAWPEPDSQSLYWTVQSCVLAPVKTKISLAVSQQASTGGASTSGVTLTATVDPKNADGSVTFYDNGSAITAATDVPIGSDGTATFNVTNPGTATHAYYAEFTPTPDSGYLMSDSDFAMWPSTAPKPAGGGTSVAEPSFDCGVASAPHAYPMKRSLPVAGLTPASGRAVDSLYPTLSWADYVATPGAGPEAKYYRVQVATDQSFGSVVDDAKTDLTSYTAQKAYPNTMLWWRVAAVDEAGHQLSWSTPQWFVFGDGVSNIASDVDSASPMVHTMWAVTRTSAASGGAYALSSSTGDRAEFTVSASSVRLYATKLPNGGYGDVYVDGVERATVSFYAARPAYRQTVFAGSLGSGTHHVAVVVDGRHARGSKGYAVTVDAISANGVTQQESAAVQRWATHRATNASHGSYLAETGFAATRTAGSAPGLWTRVFGSQVSIVGCRTPDSGRMGVWIDNRYAGSVDLYQSYTSCNRRVFASSWLSDDTHTVVVAPLGTAGKRSHGTRVSVDEIRAS